MIFIGVMFGRNFKWKLGVIVQTPYTYTTFLIFHI